MSCLPHIFSRKTNSKFFKIYTSLVCLFLFGFFSHIDMIYQSFFFENLFFMKICDEELKGNKQSNILFCQREKKSFLNDLILLLFCIQSDVHKSTRIKVTLPQVFTKNEFRTFTSQNSSCLCLVVISYQSDL